MTPVGKRIHFLGPEAIGVRDPIAGQPAFNYYDTPLSMGDPQDWAVVRLPRTRIRFVEADDGVFAGPVAQERRSSAEGG
jgi:hypothetical protein